METIHFTAVVPDDRMLHVRVPDHVHNAELDVTVLLEPRVAASGKRTVSHRRWTAIVDETAGAFAAAPIELPSDPAAEQVETLV